MLTLNPFIGWCLRVVKPLFLSLPLSFKGEGD